VDPTWLIEADVPGIDSARLQAEVRCQGMTAQVVKWRAEAPAPRDLLGSESVALDACAVVLSTLPTMRHVQAHRRWLPGGWCSLIKVLGTTPPNSAMEQVTAIGPKGDEAGRVRVSFVSYQEFHARLEHRGDPS
jgi:hypothetical protein